MKLFEIPVYALSKECLEQRVKYAFDIYKKPYPDNADIIKELKTSFNIGAFPACLWEYNHIIGYMVVSKVGKDINIEWYTSSPELQRYLWKSEKKHFFQNMRINGYHFYTGDMKEGEELRNKLKILLEGFVKEVLKPIYFADLEAFNNIDALLDYDKLLKG